MANGLGDFNPQVQWRQVALELQKYRVAQQTEWGSVNDEIIAKYIAGEASPDEVQLVESAMETHPNIRNAVEVIRGVLAE